MIRTFPYHPANSAWRQRSITQGSRKTKPNIESADDAPIWSIVNSSSVCEAPAASGAPSTPVSTTSSGFAESMNFLGGQIMDPLAQQQQLLHFIMQQSLGAAHTAAVQTSTPQQQQQQQPPPQPTSITSMSTTSGSGGAQVKSEPPDHFNPLMEHLQHQFKEVRAIWFPTITLCTWLR
ncbi:hypothetical protein COOONC_06077 [Cooperia oncophora]